MEDYPSPAEGNGLENRQACKSVRGFESCLPDNNFHGALAQLGERLLCTQEVSGSIPLGSIDSFCYQIRSLKTGY